VRPVGRHLLGDRHAGVRAVQPRVGGLLDQSDRAHPQRSDGTGVRCVLGVRPPRCRAHRARRRPVARLVRVGRPEPSDGGDRVSGSTRRGWCVAFRSHTGDHCTGTGDHCTGTGDHCTGTGDHCTGTGRAVPRHPGGSFGATCRPRSRAARACLPARSAVHAGASVNPDPTDRARRGCLRRRVRGRARAAGLRRAPATWLVRQPEQPGQAGPVVGRLQAHRPSGLMSPTGADAGRRRPFAPARFPCNRCGRTINCQPQTRHCV